MPRDDPATKREAGRALGLTTSAPRLAGVGLGLLLLLTIVAAVWWYRRKKATAAVTTLGVGASAPAYQQNLRRRFPPANQQNLLRRFPPAPAYAPQPPMFVVQALACPGLALQATTSGSSLVPLAQATRFFASVPAGAMVSGGPNMQLTDVRTGLMLGALSTYTGGAGLTGGSQWTAWSPYLGQLFSGVYGGGWTPPGGVWYGLHADGCGPGASVSMAPGDASVPANWFSVRPAP